MAEEPGSKLEPVDASHLTDADWAELNTLRQALETRGPEALSKAFEKLAKADPIRYMNIVAALFPDMVREMARDKIAEMGMTEEDVHELIRKTQGPAGNQ